MRENELSVALEPIIPTFCISFIYAKSDKRSRQRAERGKIICLIFLFFIRINAHATKQKTAHDSYNAKAQAEHRKNKIKNKNFLFFKYFVRVKRERALKKTPQTMREDAETQYAPSEPKGKNRKNIAKSGDKAMSFSFAVLYRNTHEKKWKADDKIRKSCGMFHKEPHKKRSNKALRGLAEIVPIFKKTWEGFS